jgi:hypothetical protein
MKPTAGAGRTLKACVAAHFHHVVNVLVSWGRAIIRKKNL